MPRKTYRVSALGVLLLGLTLAAPLAPAQALKDAVVSIGYLNVKPQQADAWLKAFKKHLQPALEELKQQEALRVYHVFVPGIHHPGFTWTHALVFVYKDRASQGVVEKKLQEVLAALPPEGAVLFSAIDLSKHYDDEWLEIDLEKVAAPEEKKEEGKE